MSYSHDGDHRLNKVISAALDLSDALEGTKDFECKVHPVAIEEANECLKKLNLKIVFYAPDNKEKIDSLVKDIQSTLYLPLTNEINDKWLELYKLVREQYPEYNEAKVNKFVKMMVWGRCF